MKSLDTIPSGPIASDGDFCLLLISVFDVEIGNAERLSERDRAEKTLWSMFAIQLRNIGNRQIHLCGYHGVLDADDVANEIFHRFIRRGRRGKYDWVVNIPTFVNSAFQSAKHIVCKAKKRGHRHTICESDIDHGSEILNAFADRASPFHDVEVSEALAHLLPNQRRIVGLRLSGNNIPQTAIQLGVSASTIKRELSKIRKTWTNL